MAELDFGQIGKWLGSNARVSGRVCGFKQDSRQVKPGDLFFALGGERVDGHAYLQEAASRGAIGAVVSKNYSGEDCGLQLVRVEDGLASLQNLARSVLAQRGTRVVGVTGSVGKTTTKEFLATILEGKFRVAKTPGNANSQVGLPLSILNSPGDEEVFVMEMGMNHAQEIERLVSIAPPEVALITKIALAHVANFADGIEGIASAKAEILSHPSTRVGILNHQVAQFSASERGSCAKITYGLEGKCEGARFLLCRDEATFYIKEGEARTDSFLLPLTAAHLLENFVGAAAASRAMGMQWEEILPQVSRLSVTRHRFERVEKQGIVFIDDSYNANAASMKAALTHLPSPKEGGKRIAVLGAMRELGSYSEACHREVAEVALENVDHLLCLGEECSAMVDFFGSKEKPAEHFLQLELLKERVFEIAKEGDVILLKGSNSNQLWRVLQEN